MEDRLPKRLMKSECFAGLHAKNVTINETVSESK